MSGNASLVDLKTPRHSLLSARFKHSFAFTSLHSRMPGILRQVIATLLFNEDDMEVEYGEEVCNDVRIIIESIERLEMQLQRDRQFQQFNGNEPDKDDWNAFISELPKPKRSFFRASWLHSECYLYRRLSSFFENSKSLQKYDYFQELKQQDLMLSERAILCLTEATRGLGKKFDYFSQLMRINMWSNRFEVQLNAFVFDTPKDRNDINVLAEVADLDRHLLVDDSILVWNCLMKAKGQKRIILDYICDNAGFELFTDLLLIEYILEHKMVTQVRMHVKAIPWFISDALQGDIEWTIQYLKDSPKEIISTLGKKLETLMKYKYILIAPISYFWTGPQPYFVMVDSNLELYKMLTQAQLAIFKGDLNYRKLLGDYIWDSTEEFITCLRGFRPTNICAMRNVKCEVICGLPEGTLDRLLKVDPTWMISGTYGVIQYTDSLKCKCDQLNAYSMTQNKLQPPL